MEEQVVVIGCKNNNFKFRDIKDKLSFNESVPLSSVRGKLIRHIVSYELKRIGERISDYKRVYIIVGYNISEQFRSNEENFMKTLKGEPIFDIIREYTTTILSVVDCVINDNKRQVANNVDVIRLEKNLNKFVDSMKREIDKLKNININSYNHFGDARSYNELMNKRLKKVGIHSEPMYVYNRMKGQALGRWVKIHGTTVTPSTTLYK